MQSQVYISYAHRRRSNQKFVYHSTNYRAAILLDFIESLALLCASTITGGLVELFAWGTVHLRFIATLVWASK